MFVHGREVSWLRVVRSRLQTRWVVGEHCPGTDEELAICLVEESGHGGSQSSHEWLVVERGPVQAPGRYLDMVRSSYLEVDWNETRRPLRVPEEKLRRVTEHHEDTAKSDA